MSLKTELSMNIYIWIGIQKILKPVFFKKKTNMPVPEISIAFTK